MTDLLPGGGEEETEIPDTEVDKPGGGIPAGPSGSGEPEIEIPPAEIDRPGSPPMLD